MWYGLRRPAKRQVPDATPQSDGTKGLDLTAEGPRRAARFDRYQRSLIPTNAAAKFRQNSSTTHPQLTKAMTASARRMVRRNASNPQTIAAAHAAIAEICSTPTATSQPGTCPPWALKYSMIARIWEPESTP